MENENIERGITFVCLLLIAFIVLKLTGYIDWSWWWVSLPLWIPFSVFLIVIIIAAIVDAIN